MAERAVHHLALRCTRCGALLDDVRHVDEVRAHAATHDGQAAVELVVVCPGEGPVPIDDVEAVRVLGVLGAALFPSPRNRRR